jgi:hypothetical protein
MAGLRIPVVSRSLRALRHDAGAGLSSGRLAKLAMTHVRSFPQSQLATLATAATLPALSPRPSQVSRLSQGRIGIVRPARPELSQTSRVSQRHLPEQRSARSPRQMAPQRGLPALAGLAPFVDPCPGFRPQAWAAIRARAAAFLRGTGRGLSRSAGRRGSCWECILWSAPFASIVPAPSCSPTPGGCSRPWPI